MAQIGCMEEIIFVVSSEKVLTPGNMQWSGSARFAEHQRHMYHALAEFTGLNPDRISFDIRLVHELSGDVMEALVKLWDYERKGTPLRLVIGDHGYGKYRWVIKDHKTAMSHFDPVGNLLAVTISLNLLEYLKN